MYTEGMYIFGMFNSKRFMLLISWGKLDSLVSLIVVFNLHLQILVPWTVLIKHVTIGGHVHYKCLFFVCKELPA